MRYIARQVRNHWEDEALQAKLEEVRALEIGQPRLAAMGHLQIDESCSLRAHGPNGRYSASLSRSGLTPEGSDRTTRVRCRQPR
jgi:hypothetical protein